MAYLNTAAELLEALARAGGVIVNADKLTEPGSHKPARAEECM